MELANNAIIKCIFVTYNGLCYQIMFAMIADHHSTNVRFNFYVGVKHICYKDLDKVPKFKSTPYSQILWIYG